MLTRKVWGKRTGLRYGPGLVLGSAISLAGIFGLAIAAVPALPVLVVATGVLWIAALLLCPQYGVGISFLALLFVPLFKVQDGIAVVTIVLVLGGKLANRGRILPLKPPWWFVTLLCICAYSLFSATVLASFTDAKAAYIYNDLRIFLYWLFAIVAYSAFSEGGAPSAALPRLGFLIVAISFVVALLAIIQGVFDISIVGGGKIRALDTSGGNSVESSITRVQMPGFMFIYFSTVYVACKLMATQRISIALLVAVFVVLAIGLYYNFGRAVWIVTAVSVLTAFAFHGRRGALIALFGVFAVVTSLLTAKFLFDAKFVDVLAQRISSVSEEGGYGTSFGWRRLENESAVRVLKQTFGLGVGVGGEYRNVVPALGQIENHTSYIHNGHYRLMLKLTVVGWLGMMLVFAGAFRAATRAVSLKHRRTPEMLAAAIALPGYLVINLNQPILFESDAVLAISLIFALLLFDGRAKQSSASDKLAENA